MTVSHRSPDGEAPGVRVVAWELTRRCNLTCPYCRASATTAHSDELSIDSALNTLGEIRTLGTPLVILSGGEPLLLDFWPLVAQRALSAGLPVALATNGTLITSEIAHKIRDLGIRRVSVSLDFPDAKKHDGVRGAGSFDAAMRGIRFLKEAQVSFQINLTAGRDNVRQVGEMLGLAVDLGADAFHVFFVVDVGRAAKGHMGIELADYESALASVAELERTSPIEIKVTCAPQYERIRKAAGIPDGPKRRASRGCLAGWGFLFISAIGEVKPCGYFDLVLGRIGEKPLRELWAEHPALEAMRDLSQLKGSCATCSHGRICGGCRARALSVTGDFLNSDPACAYNI
jgi:AdoMet-dependent heme synthase